MLPYCYYCNGNRTKKETPPLFSGLGSREGQSRKEKVAGVRTPSIDTGTPFRYTESGLNCWGWTWQALQRKALGFALFNDNSLFLFHTLSKSYEYFFPLFVVSRCIVTCCYRIRIGSRGGTKNCSAGSIKHAQGR